MANAIGVFAHPLVQSVRATLDQICSTRFGLINYWIWLIVGTSPADDM